MPTNLTGIGTITYNGFTFSGPRVSSEISIRPVRDQSNRTVMYTLYTLTVEAYVTADALGKTGDGSDASANTTAIRALLTKDGCALIYDGLGHGNLEVNTTSLNRDVNWGPKTQLVHFKPVGSIGCFEVVWTCEFALPECGIGAPNDGVTSGIFKGVIGNFRSFNFGVEYGIAANGCTRRTISGHYEIILHRTTSDPTSASFTQIPTSADAYREQVSPSLPFGFKRENQSWRLSTDKARMEFSITDVEMESDNAFPPGIVNLDVSHRVSSSRQAGAFSIVTNTIAGSVEMAKNYALAYGWEKMLLVMKERVQYARNAVQAGGYVYIDSLDITEHLFARKFDFSMTYRLLANPQQANGLQLKNQIANTGLFAPLQSTDFPSWAQSLAPKTWSQRGVAGLKFDPKQDSIIDPCYQGAGSDTPNPSPNTSSFTSNGSLTNVCPAKGNSYLGWTNKVSLEYSGNSVGTPVPMPKVNDKPLPVNQDINPGSAFPSSGQQKPNFSGQPIDLTDGTQFGAPPVNVLNTSKVQVSPNGKIWIVMRGVGFRLCYPCEIPQLATSINGIPTSYSGQDSRVDQNLVGNLMGIKLYQAAWELRYQLMANDLSALKGQNLDALVSGTPNDKPGNKLK